MMRADDAAFTRHLIEIACNNNGVDDVLSRAIDNTHDAADRKILLIVGAVKAAMVEAEFYRLNSALTEEPQPLPVNVDEPNPQRRMDRLMHESRDKVANLLNDLPRIDRELTLPHTSFSAGNWVGIATDSIAQIVTLIATIMQLQELLKTHSKTTK